MNRNSKSPKSSTPRLTTDVMPASYCILSVGQGMRALMRKLPGSSLPNLDMLPNSLWISTLPIQPSLVLCQVFDLGTFYFNLKSYLKFHSLQVKSVLFTILLSYSRILNFFFTTSSQAPIQTLGNPFQVPIFLPQEPLDLHQGGGHLLSLIPVFPSTQPTP